MQILLRFKPQDIVIFLVCVNLILTGLTCVSSKEDNEVIKFSSIIMFISTLLIIWFTYKASIGYIPF